LGKNANAGSTDGNDIPRREAFDWYASGEGKGTALWYKNTGVWWDNSNFKPNDGVSLEEQQRDPNSLFNYYKKLIQVRQNHAALSNGAYLNLENDNKNVFSFLRIYKNNKVLVVVNLSDTPQSPLFQQTFKNYAGLLGDNKTYQKGIALKPYEVAVWSVK
jgi:alpha-amylase